MATERVHQDGYVAKDRQMSDGAPPSAKHDSHYASTSQHNNAPHHHHHHHQHQAKQACFDVSRAEFEQFQQQVSYNYDCIQEHKQVMAGFDHALRYFQQSFERALEDLRAEVRVRGSASADAKAQSGGKYDHRDVDLLAGQLSSVHTKVSEIDNIKMQLELMKTKLKRLEDSQPLQLPPRPSTANSHREPANYDNAPAQQPHGHSGQQHAQPHSLPPIHTSPLPPPSSMSSWRPQGGPQPPYSNRSHEADPTRWHAPSGQVHKRPYDEPVTREQSAPASPKRPKLAPLKPRSTFGDEPQPYQSTEALPYHPPHRGPPNDVAPPLPPVQAPPQLLTTPASATAAPSYRFITATAPAEGDAWRNEDGTLTPASARGRGRGGRGRTRPRGSRGSDHERDTPEVEFSKHGDWHVQAVPPHPHAQPPGQHQLSPNGFYNAPRPGMHEAGPEYALPLTPIASAVSPHDATMLTQDSMNPNGKKTRTKPVRNSEGILIRKDGRPDMRSVSSANNLRKVHAKKEAERAEADARTPMSARSLAPADSQGMSDDDQKSDGNLADDSRSVSPKLQMPGREQDDRKVTVNVHAAVAAAPEDGKVDSATAMEEIEKHEDEMTS